MTDSRQLLAEYARNGSDTAFRELVNRYIDIVYSTAVRLVEGDTHRAEDVSQTVFLDLARKARTLPDDVKLGGWLHRATCLVAGHAMRGERRRQSRERQAVEMNALQNQSEADFSQVAPVLDEAINELDEPDRTAILLRFFEEHDFRTVGQALGSNEDAARMRVNRALEKLETLLKRRGVTATSVTLGVALGANAVQAAPVGLAVTISTAAALGGTTIASTATATATKAIAMTTMQKTIIGVALATVIATPVIWQEMALAKIRNANRALAARVEPLAGLRAERDRLEQVASDAAASERTAREHEELDRLRKETPALRERLQQMEQARLTATTAREASSSPPGIPAGYTAIWGAREVGAASGKALVESLFAALSRVDTNRIMQLSDFSAEGRQHAELMMLKLPQEMARAERRNAGRPASFRVVRQVPLEDGDYALVIERMNGEKAMPREAWRIRPAGNEWRVVLGKTGGPEKLQLSEEFMRE